MADREWIFVIEENKVSDDSPKLVFAKGVGIVLVRKAGAQLYAVSNGCAHMGCPLITGVFEGYAIQCPCHDWRFDIRTGEFLDAPEIKIPVYPIKAQDGKVFIQL